MWMTEINEAEIQPTFSSPSITMCGLSGAGDLAVGTFWDSVKGEIVTRQQSNRISP